MRLLKRILCLVIMFALTYSVANAEVFVIKKIRVTGLQRVNLGTVLSYLPVKEGDSMDAAQTSNIIRELYGTGFFSDVTLTRNDNELLINVAERAVIGAINMTGNSKITKKQLTAALKNVGVAEGRALDPAVLNGIKQAIVQQYYSFGMYDAKVSIDVTPRERNRVAVAINIKEGPVAKIRSIKIIGNRVFKEKTLLKEFSLTTPRLWSFFTNSDQYSKEKLDADLEKLRSYYMDRGYLNIRINTTQVAITPDKKGIYITINITEGLVYRIGGFSLEGELIGKRAEILKLITLKAGEVFSRKNIIDIQGQINQFLGDHGYGMSDVRIDPNVDENVKKVWVKFVVISGHRVYVRSINFKGNHKTNDEVLRREMRLQEGSLFSLSKINESKRRLANLGYLQEIEYKIHPVAESNNHVDLVYDVKETSAISANLQAGFSDRDGFLYGASLSDQNFLGTGKLVSLSFDNTKSTQSYGFGYHDPYFTANKVGLSFNAYAHRYNPNRTSAGLTAYTTSIYGAVFSLDAPLSDYATVSAGLGAEHIDIGRSSATSSEVNEFVSQYGTVFNQFKLIASWTYNNLDRAVFPTAGFANTVSGELDGPLDGKSLEFYKLSYNAFWYFPLIKDFIFRAAAEVGYGDGFGRNKKLPFFKNFFAGGIGSVRGFEAGALSDKFDSNRRAFGGNFITVGSVSLIIPNPIKDTVRPSIFIDIGNVYTNKFKPSGLRASYGVQVEWRTPLAPLVFSFAKPLRSKPNDYLDAFQFSISTSI